MVERVDDGKGVTGEMTGVTFPALPKGVLSPFAGIGSEGYQAVLLDRRFLGIELKPEYFTIACRNLKRAETRLKQGRLL